MLSPRSNTLLSTIRRLCVLCHYVSVWTLFVEWQGHLRLIDVYYLQKDYRKASEALDDLVRRHPEFRDSSDYAVGILCRCIFRRISSVRCRSLLSCYMRISCLHVILSRIQFCLSKQKQSPRLNRDECYRKVISSVRSRGDPDEGLNKCQCHGRSA